MKSVFNSPHVASKCIVGLSGLCSNACIDVYKCIVPVRHMDTLNSCQAASLRVRVSPAIKGTIHLQTSMPSPGFEPRLYDTAVIVVSRCISWLMGYSPGATKDSPCQLDDTQ
ncbi:hypothetical protein TNCV_3712391 [Trichonephila clavipes]|nr:hypothetical protein TNCV_3712391 [Trichonephila clavipes]